MSIVSRKLMFLRNKLSRQKPQSEEIAQEKWVADFSKQKHARFDIKSESAYDANLRKNLFYSGHSLVLALKKIGSLSWVEAAGHLYRDLLISGTIRIDAMGGYAAGGLHFRMTGEDTFYSLLISSKGFFRLDVLRNGMPFPLVGWTELPLLNGEPLSPDRAVDFSIIAYANHIIILLQGRWAAEVVDSSIIEGSVCFAAVSYECEDPSYKVIREAENVSYVAEVFLESLTIDSHFAEVSAAYEKWRESPDIDSRVRFNLAETFTAMDQHKAALAQLHKGWDTVGHKKTQRELILAGRLAQQIGQLSEAENYISQCFELDLYSPEGKEALAEMAKILYTGQRYEELKDFCSEAVKIDSKDPILWTFQGHAYWNLNDNNKAVKAYDRAFALDPKNGIIAKNAANVNEVMGRKIEALERYLAAGRVFLKEGNYNDLGLLVPKLLDLGKTSWEGRSLAGKWAFAVEDWKMAEAEFALSDKLRKAKKTRIAKDGAQVFLEALLLVKAGKRREALPLFKEAASLGKNYALFHFRLAEALFLLDDDPDNRLMLKEMNLALKLAEYDNQVEKQLSKESEGLFGWINNFAAQVAIKKGDFPVASRHLEKAVKILGNLPSVRVNQGILFYRKGSQEEALTILNADKRTDPEGIMANCAGNLLVSSGRFEEAEEKYRQALIAQSNNVEYLCNRASCLIELERYGEADELLSKAHTLAPSPAVLEMISYVAVKKGEFPRAEQACREALKLDPSHSPSLLSLSWVLISMDKLNEVHQLLRRLDDMELTGDAAKSRDKLRARLNETLYRIIKCASCESNWKVPKDPPPAPSIRLYAMPPDILPAGSCPTCGKTYCIGCAKKNLDSAGRFICPTCNKSLKLINEGLKKIIFDWAADDGLVEKKETGAKKRGRPKNPVKKPVRNPVEKAAKKPAEKPVVKTPKKMVEKPVEKTTNKPMKKPVERTIKKPAEKPVLKTIKNPTKNPVNKPVREKKELAAPPAVPPVRRGRKKNSPTPKP